MSERDDEQPTSDGGVAGGTGAGGGTSGPGGTGGPPDGAEPSPGADAATTDPRSRDAGLPQPEPKYTATPRPPRRSRTIGLTVGALGIVYGDIGTSPLYALRETFDSPAHRMPVVEANVYGALSLVFWAFAIIISAKYLTFVMRADNDGEGGILALTSLTTPIVAGARRARRTLILVGLFGTALLYGDGMITPAISVLSAVEGTTVAAPSMERFVVPIAVVILVGLFALQSRGTHRIGRVFGPIMVVWFVTLAGLGLWHLVPNLGVLEALNPIYAVRYFADNGVHGLLSLGAIFLVVTGGEALYADMGHFGRRPIRMGWFGFVGPALVLHYFGQGALLLEDPEAIDNPFYRMVPSWGLVPLLVLATLATVIASQALISGAFSLTKQASQLGYSPRLRIRHTSETEIGQIYVPAVNWILMVACIGLVVGFGSSTNLAAAYGVAVTATMAITTVLFYVVAREHFGWTRTTALALCGVFLVVDLAFLSANLVKIAAGGWFPLVIGALVFTVLTTWRTGRALVAKRMGAGRMHLVEFVRSVRASGPPRVPGDAIYLFSSSGLTPPALVANLRHNNALHERIAVLSVVTEAIPHVPPEERLAITAMGQGFHQVVMHVGFLDDPDVVEALREHGGDLGMDVDRVAFVLGRESLRVTRRPGMARWREHLFAAMSRNATPAANYFNLPPEQTLELGVAVEL